MLFLFNLKIITAQSPLLPQTYLYLFFFSKRLLIGNAITMLLLDENTAFGSDMKEEKSRSGDMFLL